MRPEYNGVKYYDKSDLSISFNLQKAETIILAFDEDKTYDDINEIIEFYNISNLMNIGLSLSSWTEEQYKKYKKIVSKFEKPIGIFFSKINDDNFAELIQLVAYLYFDDFWKLFVRYKLYERISSEVIMNYLNLPSTPLCKLLSHKELVDNYGKQLADVMRTSKQTAAILISKYLKKSKSDCFIPRELESSEFESILFKYIESGEATLNDLELIFKASSQKLCPISNKLRIKAKDELKRKMEERKDCLVIGYRVGACFENQDEFIKWHCESDKSWLISYDVSWFESNLDFPTILNNFWLVFGMFDSFCRSSLVNVQSKLGILEKVSMTKGAKFYNGGSYFMFHEMFSTSQTYIYYDFLKQHGIELEEVFKWFFEVYLPEEFGVNGFAFLASTPTASYGERIRILVSEMDGVLKQFRMFVQDGEIDRELYEMSSEHVIFKSIPSLISNKYVYPNGNDIKYEMFALFSDQSFLPLTKKTTKYSTLSEMLKNEEMVITDFDEQQQTDIKWLIDKGCLSVSENGILKLANPKTKILKDIYDNDVTCFYNYYNHEDWSQALEIMVSQGDLKIGSTLFTKPEWEYLNYKLNKAEFSDGWDLRNKYSHATYPQDAEKQKCDYIELLKIMVLIITKINDEFCYIDSQKNLAL